MRDNLYCKTLNELTGLEVFDILQLRSSVFVVEQKCIYLDADEKDKSSHHIGFYKNGILVACTRILAPGISYDNYSSIGRVCTHIDYRTLNFGKTIVQYSIECLEERYKNIPIKISAQSYLINFYSEFGFEVVGNEYLEDGIPHTGMIRNVKY